MTPTRSIAGLVLAAGTSSRMGAFKPLLRFGSATVIEAVVGLLHAGGVADVRVVTGHRAGELAPLVAGLGAVPVSNPEFARGMLSSVQAGIRSLGGDCPGCLLMPADVPLVRAGTIRILCGRAEDRWPSVIYPLHGGRRGHPPFISRRLFAEILEHDGEGGLNTILARHAGEAESIEVDDPGVVLDMDTPEDYAALRARAQQAELS